MNFKNVFTTGQAAKYLKVSPVTVYNWIRAGKLEAYKTPGGQYRIVPEILVDLMEKHNMPIPEEMSSFITKRILIVADEPMIETIVHQAIQQSGLKYQLKVAKNGYETATRSLFLYNNICAIRSIFRITRNSKNNCWNVTQLLSIRVQSSVTMTLQMGRYISIMTNQTNIELSFMKASIVTLWELRILWVKE